MNVLVVYAHPSPDSFTAAARDRVLAGLGEGRHDVTVIDLYADAAAAAAGAGAAAAAAGAAAAAAGAGEAAIRDAAAAQAAEALVFVYPTWWSGPPSILLGWLQDVLAEPKRSVHHRRHRLTSGGPWPKVRRIAVVTSHGSSKLVNMVEGESGKLLFQRALRLRLGRPARFRWLSLYRIDRATSDERTAHLDRIHRFFTAL